MDLGNGVKGFFTNLRIAYKLLRLIRNPAKIERILDVAELGYMRPGSRLFQQAVDFVMNDPAFAEMYTRKYAPVPTTSNELSALPPGTLGHEYARFLRENNLSLSYFPLVPNETPAGYLLRRIRETHDIWHVIVDFDTTRPGEIGILAFGLAQFRSPVAALISGAAFVVTLSREPEKLGEMMDAFIQGYERGRRARFLLPLKLEEMWSQPLARLRRDLGLPLGGYSASISARSRGALA
jgi:ubiquinone biosynthesis protein Coq4